MDTNNPLADLKDIHLPPPVSVFPLAIGWYVLAGLIISVVIGLLWLWFRHRRKQHQLAEIHQLLQIIEKKSATISDEETIGECPILLKRVAVLKFPDQKPQLLFANNWLQFLDNTGKTTEFTNGRGKCLGELYQRQQIQNKDQFFALLKTWLEKVL